MINEHEMNIVPGHTAVIVAHPDDEVLWGGGLLARYPGLDVICCSIPVKDPERILCFFRAMKILGQHAFLLPFSEYNVQTPLTNLELLDLTAYDTIITHNAEGEYGHPQHRQIHKFITETFRGDIYGFGFGKGKIALTLTDHERARKEAALRCYDNKSPADGGVSKWEALLAKYRIDFERESYIRYDAMQPANSSALSNAEIRARSDYQIFDIIDGRLANPGPRMQKKLQALMPVLPDFAGRTVLDIGCDFGFWSFLAATAGAEGVVGLDRSRDVRGVGRVDIPELNNQTSLQNNFKATFFDYEAGSQWWDMPKFDVVLCMSLYHHIFNVCGSHDSIWYWLWRVTGGTLIWENPLDVSDSVVQANVSHDLWPVYNEASIRAAAEQYFDFAYEGAALHEQTRVVWKLTPRVRASRSYRGKPVDGAGGATIAFNFANGRRIGEIQRILGRKMVPGSLNVVLEEPFDLNSNFVRAQLLDIVDRSTGFAGAWAKRWVRLYPLRVGDVEAWAMRFEGEAYPLTAVELISDRRLRSTFAEGASTISLTAN